MSWNVRKSSQNFDWQFINAFCLSTVKVFFGLESSTAMKSWIVQENWYSFSWYICNKHNLWQWFNRCLYSNAYGRKRTMRSFITGFFSFLLRRLDFLSIPDKQLMVLFHSVLNDRKTFEKHLFASHDFYLFGRKGRLLLKRKSIIIFPS